MYDKRLYDIVMARCVEQPGPLDTPCKCWTGATNNKGYGQVRAHNKLQLTHRLAYEAVNGRIRKGKFCLHKCDVRACCNPSHLYVGTLYQNMRDAISRGRAPQSTSTITRDKAKAIRKLYKRENLSMREVGERYGVSLHVIYRILAGITWAPRARSRHSPNRR